jgi:hypothetical protein
MISKPIHLIIISMVVFIILNIIENLIYFNSGKYGFGNNIQSYFTIPDLPSLIKLICIMVFFAFAQGFFTTIFS